MKYINHFGKMLSISALIFNVFLGLTAEGQSTIQLPVDIIYEDVVNNHSVIIKIDAHTLQLHSFYSQKNGDAMNIGWSPTGKFLAIIQNDSQYGFDLCVLSRAGILVSCMDNPINGILANDYGYAYTVAWSRDESSLYYVTDELNKITSSPGGNAYVEGDVATGKTIRILYNQPDLANVSSWPANGSGTLLLDKLIATPLSITADLIQFPFLLSKNYSSSDNTRKRMNKVFAPPSATDKVNLQPKGDDPQQHQADFCPFSPKGTYFGDYDDGPLVMLGGIAPVNVNPYEWDLLDANGNVAYAMRIESYPPTLIPLGCGAWSPNEKSLYIVQNMPGATMYDPNYGLINKMTLLDNGKLTITPYFTMPHVIMNTSPFQVSPDGNYILYADLENGSIVTVLGPNNSIATFPGISGISTHPLWVPPLQP